MGTGGLHSAAAGSRAAVRAGSWLSRGVAVPRPSPGASPPAVTPRFPPWIGFAPLLPAAYAVSHGAGPAPGSGAEQLRRAQGQDGGQPSALRGRVPRPAGLLRWHTALPGVSSVNICTFGYPSLRDRFTGGSCLAEVCKRAAPGERAGAQWVPCAGVLPALAACVHGVAAGTGGRRGNTHSRVRSSLYRGGKKAWAVWQQPCRKTVGWRLGRGGWTLLSSVAPRVPGDVTLPPTLPTRAEVPRAHGRLCTPLLTPAKSQLLQNVAETLVESTEPLQLVGPVSPVLSSADPSGQRPPLPLAGVGEGLVPGLFQAACPAVFIQPG